MKIYKATATFPGADHPSSFFYDSRESANGMLERVGNGEVEEVDLDIEMFLFNGCSWDDLRFWNDL